MKKLYSIAAVALLSLGGITTQAQDMYLIGPFNNYGEDEDLSEWKLTQGEMDAEEGDVIDETNQYTGYFNIPTGEFEIYFKFGDTYIVPATNGELSTTNVPVLKTGSFTYGLSLEPTVYWENENWENTDDAEVGFLIDITDRVLTIQIDEDLTEALFIRGAFNNYDPNGSAKWALTDGIYNENGDLENGMFEGTFKIPAGQFSFNLLYSEDIIVPEDNYEGTDQKVVFTDNVFTGTFVAAWDETEENMYWYNNDWEGGWISVIFDLNTGITIKDVTDEMASAPDPEIPDEAPEAIYIYGPLNNNNPNGAEEWALTLKQDEDEEDVVYEGYIEIPANEFYFNFTYGNSAFIEPGMLSGSEIVSTGDDLEVEFTGNLYTDVFSFGNGYFNWSLEGWEGGEVGILVNVTTQTVTFQYDGYSQETPDVWYISGQFNNFNPNFESKWALTPVETLEEEEENGVYTGTFEIPVNQFSFNLVDPTGWIYVPDVNYEGATVEIEFTDNVYIGSIIDAWDETEETCYWTYPEWEGGKIKVTIDLNISSIEIEDVSEYDAINSIQKISGDDVIYNINGLKVNKSQMVPGLYIVNGKKVMVK